MWTVQPQSLAYSSPSPKKKQQQQKSPLVRHILAADYSSLSTDRQDKASGNCNRLDTDPLCSREQTSAPSHSYTLCIAVSKQSLTSHGNDPTTSVRSETKMEMTVSSLTVNSHPLLETPCGGQSDGNYT